MSLVMMKVNTRSKKVNLFLLEKQKKKLAKKKKLIKENTSQNIYI